VEGLKERLVRLKTRFFQILGHVILGLVVHRYLVMFATLFIPRTAETLANEKSMTPIKARSRNPCRESVGMEFRSVRASSTLKSGVLPRLTTWVGPLPGAAGFVGTIWLITR
jgi:hypothetical protein